MSLPVAILAGGLGTRLGHLTEMTPKALVDVAGEPFAAHQLRLLKRHGIADVVFLVQHRAEDIIQRIGDGSQYDLNVRYVADGGSACGTGGAIRHALLLLGEAFFVLYGDTYLDCDYDALEQSFKAANTRGLMTIYDNYNRYDRSNVLYSNGRVTRYDKYLPSPSMHYIDAGVGVFRPSAFAGYPSGPLDLASVYQMLARVNDLAGYEVPNRFYEIGSLAGLAETRAYFSQEGTHASSK